MSSSTAVLLAPAYLGPDHLEARFAEQRARQQGLSAYRAKVVGQIASFRDGWAFRRRIAELVGCSIRTVQRAITQAREEGLLGVARAKPNEVPPGAKAPMSCGWSHRWVIGRGLAAAAALAAVAAAKAAALARKTVRAATRVRHSGSMTPEQLEERRQLLRRQAAQCVAEDLAAAERPPD